MRRLVPLLVIAGAVAGWAYAAEPLPDRRTVRPLAPSAPASSREAILDLLSQIEVLQNEIRQLRGQLEVQAHEIERMRTGQRNATADFDRRLQELERRGPAAASPPAGPLSTIITPPIGTDSAPPATDESASEQQAYDAAFALMKQGEYARASSGFREFIGRHPKSELAGNALYWIAEASYVTRNFKAARDEFEQVLTRFPGSTKVPDALLKVGYSQYELGESQKARETLNQVRSRFPNTAAAKAAEQRLAKMAKEGR